MAREIASELVGLVARELKLDPASIAPDTPLFEEGLELDSFAVVDLVTRLENHFDVRLSDEDFSPENFVNLRTLADVIAGYVSPAPSAATGA